MQAPPPVRSGPNIRLIVAVAVAAAAILATVTYMLFFNTSNLDCACVQPPSETPSEIPAGRRYK